MNSFGETPLFLFIDDQNARPQHSDNRSKIVELSDIGCDARSSSSSCRKICQIDSTENLKKDIVRMVDGRVMTARTVLKNERDLQRRPLQDRDGRGSYLIGNVYGVPTSDVPKISRQRESTLRGLPKGSARRSSTSRKFNLNEGTDDVFKSESQLALENIMGSTYEDMHGQSLEGKENTVSDQILPKSNLPGGKSIGSRLRPALNKYARKATPNREVLECPDVLQTVAAKHINSKNASSRASEGQGKLASFSKKPLPPALIAKRSKIPKKEIGPEGLLIGDAKGALIKNPQSFNTNFITREREDGPQNFRKTLLKKPNSRTTRKDVYDASSFKKTARKGIGGSSLKSKNRDSNLTIELRSSELKSRIAKPKVASIIPRPVNGNVRRGISIRSISRLIPNCASSSRSSDSAREEKLSPDMAAKSFSVTLTERIERFSQKVKTTLNATVDESPANCSSRMQNENGCPEAGTKLNRAKSEQASGRSASKIPAAVRINVGIPAIRRSDVKKNQMEKRQAEPPIPDTRQQVEDTVNSAKGPAENETQIVPHVEGETEEDEKKDRVLMTASDLREPPCPDYSTNPENVTLKHSVNEEWTGVGLSIETQETVPEKGGVIGTKVADMARAVKEELRRTFVEHGFEDFTGKPRDASQEIVDIGVSVIEKVLGDVDIRNLARMNKEDSRNYENGAAWNARQWFL